MVRVIVKKLKNSIPVLAFLAAAAAILSGCITPAQAERRLAPPRPTGELRLEDIRRFVPEEPARAIHLIGVYRVVYGGMTQGTEQDPALVE